MWKVAIVSVAAIAAGLYVFRAEVPVISEVVRDSSSVEVISKPEYSQKDLAAMTPDQLLEMQSVALYAVRDTAGDAGELKSLDSRPDFVSPAEWLMLRAVAGRNAEPEQELLRLVNLLRFNKQLEALEIASDEREKEQLSEAVLSRIPQRIENQEMSVEKAQRIQLRIISAMYEDEDRIRSRAAEEARRIGSEFSIKAS